MDYRGYTIEHCEINPGQLVIYKDGRFVARENDIREAMMLIDEIIEDERH